MNASGQEPGNTSVEKGTPASFFERMPSPRENGSEEGQPETLAPLIEEEADSPKERPPISPEGQTGYEPRAAAPEAGLSASEAGPSSPLEANRPRSTGKIQQGSGIESTVRAARPRSGLEARHLSGSGSVRQSAGSFRSAGGSFRSKSEGTGALNHPPISIAFFFSRSRRA